MKRDLATAILWTIGANPRARAWLIHDSILSSLRFRTPQNEEIYKHMMTTKIMFPNMPLLGFSSRIDHKITFIKYFLTVT